MITFKEFLAEKWARVETDKLRGPHQGDELELMLHHGKPAALVDDRQLSGFMPHIKSGKFLHKKIPMGGFQNSYGHAIVHAGDHYRLKKLEQEFGKNGRDHAKIGTLLGYSKDAIRHFINVPPGR